MEHRRDCRNKSKYIKITTDVSGLFSSIQKRLIEEMLFKDTDLQLVDKSCRANTQHSDYSQQYCIINFRVSNRLDLNCSHHQKVITIM